jgi:outer membrane protein OmpA-like peptidoglycan-associated protein
MSASRLRAAVRVRKPSLGGIFSPEQFVRCVFNQLEAPLQRAGPVSARGVCHRSAPCSSRYRPSAIVVTPFLPSAAEIGAAQARLLGSGAARASILGPESTTAQLWQLVTIGLSQKVVTDTLSGPALFANNSARLTPGAARVLAPLIAPLQEAGAAAVINGYASTPGSSQANYLLSYARAAAVAGFLEARGIPASSLEIIGHGATDLVAAGPSGANRRVVVVIEEPVAA